MIIEAENTPRSRFQMILDSADPSGFSSPRVIRPKQKVFDELALGTSCESSPIAMSPWNQTSTLTNSPRNSLIGCLVRKEGHVYSLAAAKGLLYTGSDSKNIRVWKDLKDFGGFKSNSGLVKAIVISGDKIFTGHQDGKIRVWKVNPKDPRVHRLAGTLPALKDVLKSSVKPSNYVEVRRHRTALWIRHNDAVSCLSLDEDEGLLYSASWDRTMKVWRMADSKCVESVSAHDDAINAVAAAHHGLVLTGSADGSVKVWKRERLRQGHMRHTLVQTLVRDEGAVTALAVAGSGSVVYCGSSDGAVKFWERILGEGRDDRYYGRGGILRGHTLAVLCLAAAGSSTVVSGSADKTVRVWKRDGRAHRCVSVLSGHAGPVKCVTVEAEKAEEEKEEEAGRTWVVYSGSLDKSVRVWRVTEHDSDFSLRAMI